MKMTAFLILYAGLLITLNNRVLASGNDERGEKWKAKSGEVPPTLLTLPSFPSFSLPALNFPYLQAFSQPNRISPPERVRATKTEYVEVTRRQTVHPLCYTAYETKAPCLPYALSDFQEDDFDNLDFDTVHQAHDSFILNEAKNYQPSTIKDSDLEKEKNSGYESRTGKYLELKLRKHEGAETPTKIEGSEFLAILNRVPNQYQTTEHQTKTVLVTKLEKYTDRRVTATLLAVNCLPVDRSIPMCQNRPSPIREAPDRRSDGEINYQPPIYEPTQASPPNPELENPQPPYNPVKTGSTNGTSTFGPEHVNTKENLETER